MIHQSSTRSTSSSRSSSSSCSSAKNVEPSAVLNLTLYGSPAPRSMHRTSLGAVRARPRQKSIKPTTTPPSTPDLHLDLGSLAGSDSENDCSAGTTNLLRLNAPEQQDKGYLKHQHSNLTSSTASSCHLSKRSSNRPQNQKHCRKINQKSKVSQMLFHNDELERNKFNSSGRKLSASTEREYSRSQLSSKKNQHSNKYTAKKASQKSGQIPIQSLASNQAMKENSQAIAGVNYKESEESDSSVSNNHSSIERSNCCLKGQNYCSMSKECNNFHNKHAFQTSARYPQRPPQQKNLEDLNSGNRTRVRDLATDSGAESYFEAEDQNSLSQNNAEVSATCNNIIRHASKEERSFYVLDEDNKLFEEEYKNMSASNTENTIINEVNSKSNTDLPNLEPAVLKNQNYPHNTDVCTKDIKSGKYSAHWFIPNNEGKRKHFRESPFTTCHRSVSNTYSEENERNSYRTTEDDNCSVCLTRGNVTNCSCDCNKVSVEIKEEERTLLSSSQVSLGRERKNSDASWSSYNSSTYTTLSDSTWGCSSDTYESFHSEEISHGNCSFNTVGELHLSTPKVNPPEDLRSEKNTNAISETASQKQTNYLGPSSENELSSNLQREARKVMQSTESRCINRVQTNKDSNSDGMCPMKNDSSDDAYQTRQSSSSGITGSMTNDSNADVCHPDLEYPLQEFRSDEHKHIHKVSPSGHETPSEEWAVEEEEEEEELKSMTTSEELCLLCSCNLKACRCPSFPDGTNANNTSISGNNSDNEHIQNLTGSINSFPKCVRNISSAPEYNFKYEGRTKLLMQRLGSFTTAPDVLLSADEVMEAAMYARQLVRVLEQALDRALSLKMTSFSEMASQSSLRRSQSVPEFSSKRSFSYEDHIPFSTESSSLNIAHIPKNDKWQESNTNDNKKHREENAELRECFTNDEFCSLNTEKQNDQKNEIGNLRQEKCYCCGPKLLNVSPKELQQQKALLRPVDKKPQNFTIMRDMASILKNAISQRRDIIVPPEDGAYYVSRSVSEWSIDE